jgi:hypothetical protein
LSKGGVGEGQAIRHFLDPAGAGFLGAVASHLLYRFLDPEVIKK